MLTEAVFGEHRDIVDADGLVTRSPTLGKTA